jgi:hypothetical protein
MLSFDPIEDAVTEEFVQGATLVFGQHLFRSLVIRIRQVHFDDLDCPGRYELG